MSGIAALYDLRGAPLEADAISSLLGAIAHRGPLQSTWQQGSVALGERLLPTTPEAMAEGLPLTVAGGLYQVALDGRLDNRDDLLGALQPMDSPAITDADLIALAYERWGDTCAGHLLGDFAFILWDCQARRMYAARDQRGFRPLYYAFLDRCVVLGSEPAQILASGGIPRTVDALYLACFLTGSPPPSGATPFASIEEVPPAHFATVDASGLALHEYWRPSQNAMLRYGREEEYVEHFEAVVGEAVAAATRSVSVPAVKLSGGLDSSYVLSRALEAAPATTAIHGFAPGTKAMDERSYARQAADHLGIRLAEVDAGDCWTLSSHYLPQASFDQPNIPVQAPFMVRVGQEAQAQGCRVLLDGIGGDEFLGGPADYMADLLLGGRPLDAVSEARAWARASGRDTNRTFARAALLPLLPAAVQASLKRGTGRPGVSAYPSWIDPEALTVASLGRALELSPEPAAWQRAKRERRFWSFHARDAIPALGWRERWAALPYSLEVRSPLYDLRVIEFAARVPSWMHWDGTSSKRLLRRAMSLHLPKAVVERTDKGYYTELLDRGVFEEEAQRVGLALEESPLNSLPYVNTPALLGELEVFRRERRPRYYSILRAISAGLWLHGEATSVAEERREAVAV
jgi:asparagine synthase (glutamine-hydrolysing)